MTINNQSSTVTHTGNGVTTLWPYDFIIPTGSDKVGLFEISTSNLVELDPSDYTISGLDDENGGEVTYPLMGSPLSALFRIVIWREVEYTQDTNLTNQTPYYPEVLEAQLDRIVMQIQQLAAEAERSLKVTLGSNLDPDTFIAELQAGAAIATAQAIIATDAAIAAAASAASINLPAIIADTFLRANGAGTGYVTRTATQVLADIAAIGGSSGATDNRLLRADGVGGFTAQSSAVTVDDSGHITAFGGNIKFPAAAVASADVNTLDDYEEGTWSPTLMTDGVNFTSVTYDATRVGSYVKIGKLVHIEGKMLTDAVTVGAASGLVQIGNLPFAAAALNSAGALAVSLSATWAGEKPNALQISNTAMYLMYRSAVDGDSLYTAVADVGTGANANSIVFAGTYIATS